MYTKQLEEQQKQQTKQKYPSRNLRDIYSQAGRGLDILYFYLFMFFLRVCLCFFMCVFYVFAQLFQVFAFTIETTHIKTKRKTMNNSKNNRNNRKNKISQPGPERYLFAVGSRAGYLVFLFIYVFLRVCFCLFLLCFMFSPSCFKFLHLQSKQHV